MRLRLPDQIKPRALADARDDGKTKDRKNDGQNNEFGQPAGTKDYVVHRRLHMVGHRIAEWGYAGGSGKRQGEERPASAIPSVFAKRQAADLLKRL